MMKWLCVLPLITSILTGCISVQMDLDSAKIAKSNPASEFCLQQKGFLDFETDKQGKAVGMCHLPNGQVIEEWQYYRMKNPNR